MPAKETAASTRKLANRPVRNIFTGGILLVEMISKCAPPSEVELVISTVDLLFGHIRPAFSENVKPKNNVQCSILCGVSILYKVVPASISKFV